jgi:hypothetical protein
MSNKAYDSFKFMSNKGVQEMDESETAYFQMEATRAAELTCPVSSDHG